MIEYICYGGWDGERMLDNPMLFGPKRIQPTAELAVKAALDYWGNDWPPHWKPVVVLLIDRKPQWIIEWPGKQVGGCD